MPSVDFDLYLITDRRQVPPGRSLVMCHDVDAFAGVLPGTHGQSVIGRVLGERLLAGLRAAARIVCGSYATREALVKSGVRLTKANVFPSGTAADLYYNLGHAFTGTKIRAE